jgi:hypothetical protein
VFECSAVTDEIPSEHNFQFSVEDLSLLMGENAHIGSAEYAPADSNNAYGDDLVNALKDLDEFFNEDLDKTDVGVNNADSDYAVDFNFQVAPPSPVTPPIFYKTPSAIFDFSRKLINRASGSVNNSNHATSSDNPASSVRFPDARTLDLPAPSRPEHREHVLSTVPRQSFDTTDSVDSTDSDSTFDDRLGDAESHRSGKSGRSRRSRKSSKSHQDRHGNYF